MIDLNRRQALLLAAAAAGAPGLALAADPALPTVWDLTHLYPSDAAWETERKAVEADLPKVGAFKGRLGESAATLLQAS